MRILSLFAAALFGLAAVSLLAPSQKAKTDEKFRSSPDGIPGRYIVVLDETAVPSGDRAAAVNEFASANSSKVDHVFTTVILGYSGEMTEAEAVKLSEDARVRFVEQDTRIEAQTTQTNATWGIARIDQRPFVNPLDTEYNYQATGTGVNAYVVDTGVLTTHPDFGGRAVAVFDSYNENVDFTTCNGHGTHVAGTIGSSTYGVAKNVRIFSLKVFPCAGGGTSSASVISAIDWINQYGVTPGVVNLSLGGSPSTTLDRAIKNSITRGFVYVVAAGNDSDDACNHSPSGVAEAITVGSTHRSDSRDETTNYGRCIDLFAPGVAIESTWNQYPAPYPTFIMSGTSSASPHVAGIAALYLETHPTASPAEVSRAITANATAEAVYNPGPGSPNLLAYSLFTIDTPVCSTMTGTVTGTGATDYQSSVNGFNGRTGIYTATLNVPTGAQYRLGLQVKKGGRWGLAAQSSGTSSVETVTYRGKSGTYRWSILSLSGSGTYSLCSLTP